MCKMKFKNLYHIYYYFEIIIIIIIFYIIPGTIRTILTKFYIYYILYNGISILILKHLLPCRDDV